MYLAATGARMRDEDSEDVPEYGAVPTGTEQATGLAAWGDPRILFPRSAPAAYDIRTVLLKTKKTS